MSWFQKEITIEAHPRGFHLITDSVKRQVPQIEEYAVGLAHVFIKHTSASLALNENADPTVRGDLERHFNQMVPEEQPY
ncbi:MAG: YjbQ family protein, partial [Candidatus Promineifilaceae bacterium]|nr:YjbQ family protein [Candidatus Promineifilaceae bacterium]